MENEQSHSAKGGYMTIKRTLITLLIIGLSLSLYAGGSGEASTSQPAETIVTLAAPDPWNSLCPYGTHGNAQSQFMVPMYDSLTAVTSVGEIQPRIAESWSQSEDGQVVTVKIREDATWTDGTPITAEDVVYSFTILTDPEYKMGSGRNLHYFVGTDDSGNRISDDFGVREIDDHTVEFRIKPELTTSIENLMYRGIGNQTIVPKHATEHISAGAFLTDPYWEHPVTSGAYKFDSYISGERIEYVARDDYWLGRGDIDRLIIRVIPANNMLSALMTGEVDTTTYGSLLPLSDWELAANDPNLVAIDRPGFNNEHVLINNMRIGVELRRALDFATNKQSLVDDLVNGHARVAISAIVPENPYRLEGLEGNPYDPDKAREILDSIGWDSSQTLTLVTNASRELSQNIAVILQQQWAEVGINVEIETYDMATLSAMFYDGDYDLAVMQSASNSFEPSESRFYFPQAPNGWLNMPDSSWTDLYDKGVHGTTIEERKPYYDELQRRLVEEVPMIFLFHNNTTFVSSKRIGNVPYDDFAVLNWRFWEWTVND